jgi:protein involved in polysaccharide export with SLBB domain
MDVVVRKDGQISLPPLGDVQAAGLTPIELKELLTGEFSDLITDPDVSVIVIRREPISIDCGGARLNVRVPLTQDRSVLESLCPQPPKNDEEQSPAG